MLTNKDRYHTFCEQEKGVPIFNQDWWLDAVCGQDNWNVVLVEKGGSIVGALPYCIDKKLWFNRIQMPLLTQTLGPYINYPVNQKYYKRLSWEKEVYSDLIKQLPNYDFFQQSFSPQVTNWLPFYWHGFKQTTRYTYRIKKITEEQLENEYETDIRRRRKKAANLGVTVEELHSVDDFFCLNKKTFNRKNMQIPYSKDIVERIYDACMAHDAVKMFAAKLPDGTVIAANFLVYDYNTVYYLMGGIDPDTKDMGGMDIVQHSSILFALQSDKVFDFEGSMVESIEKYFRSFGAIQVPYLQVYRYGSRLYKCMKNIKDIFTSV